jgi:hypothetical protein
MIHRENGDGTRAAPVRPREAAMVRDTTLAGRAGDAPAADARGGPKMIEIGNGVNPAVNDGHLERRPG